jgi:hypothetical protein
MGTNEDWSIRVRLSSFLDASLWMSPDYVVDHFFYLHVIRIDVAIMDRCGSASSVVLP